MTSEDANAAVRKEVQELFEGTGAYTKVEWGHNYQQIISVFLERNIVVRLPEQGQLKVTRDGETILINGHLFSENSDLFHWQQAGGNSAKLVEARAEGLRWAVLDLEKRRAVLAHLTQEQAKVTQYEAERQERRDQVARRYFEGNPYNALLEHSRKLIDRLIDAEDRAEAIKP